jgi:hypothetical protein
MTTTVLVLGLNKTIIDEMAGNLDLPRVDLHLGTGIDDLRGVFARGPVDHVIMGAGLDLDTRLTLVREIFTLSQTTTVHLKDVASGPAGLLPFVRSLLSGLDNQP